MVPQVDGYAHSNLIVRIQDTLSHFASMALTALTASQYKVVMCLVLVNVELRECRNEVRLLKVLI
jgi:hypothetical protein